MRIKQDKGADAITLEPLDQAAKLLNWMERKVANNIKIKNHFYVVLE